MHITTDISGDKTGAFCKIIENYWRINSSIIFRNLFIVHFNFNLDKYLEPSRKTMQNVLKRIEKSVLLR